MDGRVENRMMDWGKHKEVKLVHEVKMEVDSRDYSITPFLVLISFIFLVYGAVR